MSIPFTSVNGIVIQLRVTRRQHSLVVRGRAKGAGQIQKSVQARYCVTRLELRKSCYPGEGAGNRVRTDDLLITNQLLYQLSYAGIRRMSEKNHILAVAATYASKTPRPNYASKFPT